MTETSDARAMLSALMEHPHDDTVRMAYADAVQEQGQETKAALIRTKWHGILRVDSHESARLSVVAIDMKCQLSGIDDADLALMVGTNIGPVLAFLPGGFRQLSVKTILVEYQRIGSAFVLSATSGGPLK